MICLKRALCAGALAIASSGPLAAAPWELVWSDEFNGTGLPDKTKWKYEVGWVRNNELQYYTKDRLENIRQENGSLVIEGRKEKFKNPGYKPGADPKNRRSGAEFADYTAASINTDGIAGFLYGRIEVRAKLPQGKGIWPAIWMMGTNHSAAGWPRCGEIDIMEFVGKEPDKVHATVHWFGTNKHQSLGSRITTKEPYADFHLYAVEWYPDRMDFYFDKEKYFTYPIAKAGEGPENPFHKAHYLLINLALGGSWGGPMDDAVLPQKYYIDYVRVYREKK
jgi:beta-glucanase (GH16 family)